MIVLFLCAFAWTAQGISTSWRPSFPVSASNVHPQTSGVFGVGQSIYDPETDKCTLYKVSMNQQLYFEVRSTEIPIHGRRIEMTRIPGDESRRKRQLHASFPTVPLSRSRLIAFERNANRGTRSIHEFHAFSALRNSRCRLGRKNHGKDLVPWR